MKNSKRSFASPEKKENLFAKYAIGQSPFTISFTTGEGLFIRAFNELKWENVSISSNEKGNLNSYILSILFSLINPVFIFAYFINESIDFDKYTNLISFDILYLNISTNSNIKKGSTIIKIFEYDLLAVTSVFPPALLISFIRFDISFS